MTTLPLLLPLQSLFDTAMEPLYTAVSAILVFWHWLFSPLFGADSGLTWVLSIVFLTFVIRTAMIPLFVKTIKSSRNMQLIQPKVAELQQKYGADRERLGQETMKLYREEGVNPMASCLPLLIQMPIFWALFRVLSGVAAQPEPLAYGYFLHHNPALVDSLRNAHVLGASLSGRFFPLQPFGATQIMALFLMVAMTAVLFVTQLQMTRKNMTPEAMTGQFAQQQKMMLYIFPFIYLVTGVSIPVGVLVYWLTTNLWTLVQQWILITRSPAPNTPAYLDWEDRMRRKGLDPRQIERERAAKRDANRRRPANDAEAPTTVQRQTVQRPGGRTTARRQSTSTGATAWEQPPSGTADVQDSASGFQSGSGSSASGSTRQTVTRQQPKKNTRAVRRKG